MVQITVGLVNEVWAATDVLAEARQLALTLGLAYAKPDPDHEEIYMMEEQLFEMCISLPIPVDVWDDRVNRPTLDLAEWLVTH